MWCLSLLAIRVLLPCITYNVSVLKVDIIKYIHIEPSHYTAYVPPELYDNNDITIIKIKNIKTQ